MKKPTGQLLAIVSLAAFAAASGPGCGGSSEQGLDGTGQTSAVKLLSEQEKDRFVRWWGLAQDYYKQNVWLGVQTLQNPLDAWIIQEIMYEVRPDFVVEAGTYKGGSAALWAMLLEQMNPEGRVITVDVTDITQQARRLPIVQRKVDFLIGSSVDPAIVAEVRRRIGTGRTLVILDSLHTRDHVLKELRAYSPLVSVGSYLVVQDTGLWRPIRDHPGGWASDAVEEFLVENAAFVPDTSRERFWLTNCPNSWLKRVR